MTLIPIGITKNIEVYRDTDYQYSDNEYILILKNTKTIRIQDKDSNKTDFTVTFSLQSTHITRVCNKIWVIKLLKDFFIFDLDKVCSNYEVYQNEYIIPNSPIADCKIKPYQDIHITSRGLYVVYGNCCYYQDFKGKKIMSLVKSRLDTFHFYKNCIMVRKDSFYYVFYNLNILPVEYRNEKNFSDIPIFLETDKKVTVNFKDKKKDIRFDILQNFNSEFINEQLMSGNEIFLDIEYKNFDFDNLETLKYFDSKLLDRIQMLDMLR